MMEAIHSVDRLKYNLNLGPGYGGYSELLQAVQFDDEALEPFLHFSDEHYQRLRIYDTNMVEAVLSCWEPGQVGLIHDFHNSLGWFKDLRGAIGVEHFNIENGNSKLRFNYDYPSDTTGFLNDDLGFHRFKNLCSKRTVVLHLYADKIKHWEVFNENSRQIEGCPVPVDINFDRPA